MIREPIPHNENNTNTGFWFVQNESLNKPLFMWGTRALRKQF